MARKLEATNLKKSYQGRHAVKGISLQVSQGQVVGLLGPNGAGKTTAFYMIVGVLRPDEGSIHLDGQNITGFPMHKRAKAGLGYLSQERSIFRKLTVEENLIDCNRTGKICQSMNTSVRVVDINLKKCRSSMIHHLRNVQIAEKIVQGARFQ